MEANEIEKKSRPFQMI